MSTVYQKIPGPFMRDPKTNRLREGDFTSPELEAVAGVPWLFTEKVDGTNIRIEWDGYRVSFEGRTDKADIPQPLLQYLRDRFGGEDTETLFEQKFGEIPVVLYGEGYGPKINGGGKYRDQVSFVLFDVRIEPWWLLRDAVEDIAEYFGIDVVPIVLGADEHVDLYDAIALVKAGLPSLWSATGGPDAGFEAEGLVGVTKAGLLNRKGERIMVKVKARDFR